MEQQTQLNELTRHAEESGGEVDGLAHPFIVVCSHELRNSLSGIRSAACILRMEVSPAPAVVRARLLIERQVTQMARLIEDLLDASRAPLKPLRLRRERFDLRATLMQAVQAVEFTLQHHDHRLTKSLPSTPLWLCADSSRLEQVFVNLLVNAVKYTDAGGNIELSLQQEAGDAVVRIRDSGIGIASDALPHVFDLFFRASSAHRQDAGLGVGLALVRSLVESHGGSVAAVSAGHQQGSEFTIRLPMGRN